MQDGKLPFSNIENSKIASPRHTESADTTVLPLFRKQILPKPLPHGSALATTLETQYRRDERIIRFLTFKQDKYAVEYSEKRRAKLSNKQQEE